MEVISAPYCGNMLCIGMDSKNALLQQSISLAGELAMSTKSCYDSTQWKHLKDKVEQIAHRVSKNKDTFYMEEYKFQILSTAVLPYMSSMQSRMKLESRRFQQINKLLYLLCDENCQQQPPQSQPPQSQPHVESPHPHPAAVLLLLDEVSREITSEAGWWQSELGSSLQSAVDMQWLPILQDHRWAYYIVYR